jgi:hypothetical protein
MALLQLITVSLAQVIRSWFGILLLLNSNAWPTPVRGLIPRAKILRLITVNKRFVSYLELLMLAVVSAKNIIHQSAPLMLPQATVNVREKRLSNTASGMNLYRSPIHAMAVAKIMC